MTLHNTIPKALVFSTASLFNFVSSIPMVLTLKALSPFTFSNFPPKAI